MAEKGLIYKGLKPVYWSPSSESALAEAEIEYQDKEDFSIYFKLPIVNSSELQGVSFLVWTTTPWTLPANLAVCAGPNIEYVLADTDKGKFIFCLELKEKLTELLELKDLNINRLMPTSATSNRSPLIFFNAKKPDIPQNITKFSGRQVLRYGFG